MAWIFDGVIYRWDDTARYLLKTHFGFDLGPSQSWDWIKDHVSKEAWAWLWTKAITDHGLFRYGSIYKGAREFLERTQGFCDNVVITSRPQSAVLDTVEWLGYQKFPTAEIHIIGAGNKKSQVLPQCDIYVDDATHNAQDVMENTPALMIMPDKLYNQQYNPDDFTRFHRTYSWEHIESILKTLHEQVNREPVGVV